VRSLTIPGGPTHLRGVFRYNTPVTLAPLFACAAALLAVAGLMKLRAPQSASGALAALSLPAAAPAVRLAGACELAIGVWALAAPGRLCAAVLAAAYVGFAVFVAGLLRRGESTPGCGCFGEAESELHPIHLAMNLLAAAAAGVAVASPPPGVFRIAADHPATGIVLCLAVAGAVYAAYLVYTAAPSAWRAFRGGAA
jgi:uncharacterized protein YjeT (DUF2065 family)